MLKSSLCIYSDAYIVVKRIITITGEKVEEDSGERQGARKADKRDKAALFKNCAPFNNRIRDVLMPMYDLIVHGDNYLKASGSLWQYYIDESDTTIKNSQLLKSKFRITGKRPAAGKTKDVMIALLLNYLSNFWRTLEIPLINCEINLIVTWSANYVINNSTDAGTFAIIDAKPYVTVVTLSTQDDAKLLQQLKPGFKITINWNKFQSKLTTQSQNQELDYLSDPSVQGVNRLFVLSFENNAFRTGHREYFLPKTERKITMLRSMEEIFLISQWKMIT